jgi:hypothetical protein
LVGCIDSLFDFARARIRALPFSARAPEGALLRWREYLSRLRQHLPGQPGASELTLVVAVGVLFFAHLPFHLTRHEREYHRNAALKLSQAPEITGLHRWVREHLPAGAVVVADEYLGLYTVAGAGRAVVAMPSLHANPYVPHEPRREAREQMLKALAQCDIEGFLALSTQHRVSHAVVASSPCLASSSELRELVRFGELSVWSKVMP